MTREDALVALESGERIRFHSWWWGRYVEQRISRIYDEKGAPFDMEDTPEDGWEIYNEDVHGVHNEKVT